MRRLLRQMRGLCPFEGTLATSRVPLFRARSPRPTLPFPHPWNFQEPLKILETIFSGADDEVGSARHNRFLEIPGLDPFFFTRDPQVIRAITVNTGDLAGQFDRDTLPSDGIARATGRDSLLYSNGPAWRTQKKLAASPFGKSTLFQPENFDEFFETFRHTVRQRLAVFRERAAASSGRLQVPLESEIKPVMLELLTNSFFGAELSYDDIRNRFVPSLEWLIDHIVKDTVMQRIPLARVLFPPRSAEKDRLHQAQADFEELTDHVLAQRRSSRGLWKQFRSDVPDDALRSNLRVFLAGALEATTSFASWAISHLARNTKAQDHVYQEVARIEQFTPEAMAGAQYLIDVMDETLRLTPSLYFLPRRAVADTWVRTADGRELKLPARTHVLLDVWDANRHEDHWGTTASGFPALEFVPERWRFLAETQRDSKEMLHFGFGHGPRVCPGKHLGQLEVALVVGSIVRLARFTAVNSDNPARAGVSTKPADGCLVDIELREG